MYRRGMDSLFEVHRLNEAGMAKATAIAQCFDGLLIQLKQLCVDGREFSIVKTKLEEAAFFAKKAMAKSPENQQENPAA